MTSWTAACQASLSLTVCHSLLKLMSTESMMPSSHLILCCSLLLLPSVVPSIKVFALTAARHPLHAFSDCVEYGTVMIPFYQCRNLSFRKASVLSHYYTSGTGIPAQVCSQLSDGTRWFQLPLSFSS